MRKMRLILAPCAALAGLLAAVAVVLPVPAYAGDWQAAERVETYTISGDTGIALYRSIGENGPATGDGRVIAHTDYDLTWHREYRPTNDGGCRLAVAWPNLVITYRLPKPAGALPAATQRLWETFIAGVRRHERGHGAIITAIVEKIEALSVGLTAADDPGCTKVRAELQSRLPALAAELRQRNRAYDREEFSEGGVVHRLILALVNERSEP